MGPLFKLKDKGTFPSNIPVSISSLYWIKVELRTNICCLKKEKEEFKRGQRSRKRNIFRNATLLLAPLYLALKIWIAFLGLCGRHL